MYSLKKMTQKISKTYTLSFPKAAHSLEAQAQVAGGAQCAPPVCFPLLNFLPGGSTVLAMAESVECFPIPVPCHILKVIYPVTSSRLFPLLRLCCFSDPEFTGVQHTFA